jgi:two-component system heavy metal sensor histidine kinase CusS
MKSIRLSLMAYFLVPLTLALVSAFMLAYQNAEAALQEKERNSVERIEAQYLENCQQEKDHLNETLLREARSLYDLVQLQVDRSRIYLHTAHLLGLISAGTSPNAYLLAPTWIAESVPYTSAWQPWSTVFFDFHRKTLADVTLTQDELLLPMEGPEYFQIDSPGGNSYYSRSLAGRAFPPNTGVFSSTQPVEWKYDDLVLEPDIAVHRIVFKAPLLRRVFIHTDSFLDPRRESPPPPRPRSDSGSRSRPEGSPRIRREQAIYIHYAVETETLEAALHGLAEDRDKELAAVKGNTEDSLRRLRHRLLTIGLVVFAVVAVGTFWLVHLSLSPLHRVSEAVSRVSPRDFRLDLDPQHLPAELQPVVSRLSGTLNLLKRAFEREKQAVADISHELRTPLSALLTTTEIALRKPRSAEQYRELLQDCRNSAQQMNQIVERLLTLARLDAGVDRLRVQTVDVAALAQQCAAVVRPLAEARGLQLTIESPDAPSSDHAEAHSNGTSPGDGGSLVIRTDPDKLREVVTNLLHNAIQYNRPEGRIDLRVGRSNGHLDLEVRDTGIGIAPEARERIFERFYRVDPSRCSDDLHAGLGLAIVKEYVDLMGGTIGVDSKEGQGSTFRIHLPVT